MEFLENILKEKETEKKTIDEKNNHCTNELKDEVNQRMSEHPKKIKFS